MANRKARRATQATGGSALVSLGPAIDKLLTEQQVADILVWDRKTLQRRRWLGLGPKYVRIGERSIRYRERDIAEFIQGGSGDEAR